MRLFAKGILVLGRLSLLSGLVVGFVLPPIALFSPYLLYFLLEATGLNWFAGRMRSFFVLPLLVLLVGLLIWVALERLAEKLLR